MGTTVSWTVFAIAAVAISASAQPALTQNLQTIAEVPSVQSALPATAGDLKDLRFARPLSSNEEIALRPRDQFKECETCPEMIVVPAGHFLMGAKRRRGRYPR